MKIKSMQAGGIVYTPFIPQRQEVQQQQSSNTSSNQGKMTGTLKKEVIDLLKENGLQNDVDTTLNAASQFLTQSSMLSNFAAFGGSDPDFSLAQLMQVQSLVNRTKRNKEEYDMAVKAAAEQNALSDVAIDGNGYMYALDENKKLTKIKPTDYQKSPDKYQILNYKNLMYLRESDSNLAFNQNLIQDVGSAVGIETISDYLVGIVKDFGTQSESGYVKKVPQKVQDGIQALLAGGPSGSYKVTQESQIKDINEALSYLDGLLSSNPQMKHTIEAFNAVNGRETGAAGRYKFIYDVIQNHTSTKLHVDFDKTTSDDGLGSGSSSSGSLIQEPLSQAYVTGDNLGQLQQFSIFPAASNSKMLVWGQWAGQLVDRQGDNITQQSVQSAIDSSPALRKAIDMQSVSFGDQAISPVELKRLMFDSNSQMYRVVLPYKSDGGRIIPDFESLLVAEELNKEIQKRTDLTDSDIQYLVKNALPNATWDAESQSIKFTKHMPFMTFGAYAASKGISKFNRDSPFVHKVEGEDAKIIRDEYNNLVTTGNIYGTGNQEYDLGPEAKRKHMYQGNVFIAMPENLAGAIGEQYELKDTYTNIAARSAAKQAYNNIKSNF